MQYYDQHLHTYFSFDSEEKFENYLAYQPEFFVSTDHFDLNNPSTGKDDIPDYPAYINKLDSLKKPIPPNFCEVSRLALFQDKKSGSWITSLSILMI